MPEPKGNPATARASSIGPATVKGPDDGATGKRAPFAS
jgi:hypothetical protein